MDINNLKINLTVTDLDTNTTILLEEKQCTLMSTVVDWSSYQIKQHDRIDRSIEFIITNLKTNEEIKFAKVS